LLFFFQSLGNHEFDDGVDGLLPFVEAANHPVKQVSFLRLLRVVVVTINSE
jgi:2',3'-cyclic-nucleotide 2'-phosphodiesterase (5'-nucleotidase family)